MAFNQTLQVPNVSGSTTVLSNTTPVASFGNITPSGIVGTANTTTNVNTAIEITQTTANITISLATPTVNPLAAKVFTVKSSTASTQMFTMYGANVHPGQTIMVLWNGTVFSAIGSPVADLSMETASTLTYTSTRWNNVILCNATTQAVTVTLAANTIANIGKSCIVVKIAGANPVNITATGLVGTANVITDIGTAITYIPTTTLQTISLSGGGTGTGTVVARVATTTNGVLATAFANASIIDGILLATNDIILIKDQTVASENGVYRVNAAGAPTRTLTTDATIRQVSVSVTQGTVNGNIEFKNTNQTAITVGTTSITYANVSIGSIPNRPGNNVFAVSLTNYAANGSVGTAAATVDISSYFRLIQTTSSISVTLPTPSVIGTRMITFDNDIISSWAITVNGRYIMPGESALLFFNGAIWKPVSDVLGIVPIPTASVNGNILTAAASSDVAKIITFQQNTTGITSTLLNPTIATDYKTVTLCNLATSLFPITIATAGDTVSIAVGQSVDIQWNGTAWRLKSPAQVLPEFGSVILNNQLFTTTSFVDSTNGVYAIPSAGTWKLRYDLSTDGTGVTVATSMFAIHDSLGAIVPGTERARAGASTVGEAISAEATVVTTGPTTYTLKGRNGGSGAGSSTILNNASYDSTISWIKISGFSPVIGQTVSFINSFVGQTNTNVAPGDHIKFASTNAVSGSGITLDSTTAYTSSVNVASIGRFTLKGGSSYRLAGNLGDISYTSSTTNYVTFRWFNADTNTAVGDQTTVNSDYSGGGYDGGGGFAVAIVSPSVDTRYELRIVASGGMTGYGGGLASSPAHADIVQLGSTAISQYPILVNNTINSISGLYSVSCVRWNGGNFEFFEDQYFRFDFNANNFRVASKGVARPCGFYGFNSASTAAATLPWVTDSDFIGKGGYNTITVGAFTTITDVGISSDYDDIQVIWMQTQSAPVKYRVTLLGGSELGAIVERWDMSTIPSTTKITLNN